MATHRPVALLVALAALAAGCGPDERLRQTSKGDYDPETGLLRALTYDRNKNGRIDTWMKMDGARPISSEQDTDEDGVIDRWEEYGARGELVRAGWIRQPAEDPTAAGAGQAAPADPAAPVPPRRPDTWLYPGADGRSHRIEFLDLDNSGQQVVTRREFFVNDQKVRVEEDKDGDGIIDQWETWEDGQLKTAEFDDGQDGKPDRRFTYTKGALTLIESMPDATGTYTRRVVPGGR